MLKEKNSIHRNALIFMSFVVMIVMMFSSCKEETELYVPSIKCVAIPDYVWNDTALSMGTLMKFKIVAECEEMPITNFVISFDNGESKVLLDTGIYDTRFEYVLNIYKGNADVEYWSFSVMNFQRQKASLTLRIDKASGSQFGAVQSFENIELGAQSNSQKGSFFSLSSGQVYTLEEAAANQTFIDIAYYYDAFESTLSSPNDNDAPSIFQGTYGISGWIVRNETRYNITSLDFEAFQGAQNDSLLISSYDPVNAKRKGKFVKSGDVWAFRNCQGRLGLLYVHSLSGTTSGSIVFSVKFQAE